MTTNEFVAPGLTSVGAHRLYRSTHPVSTRLTINMDGAEEIQKSKRLWQYKPLWLFIFIYYALVVENYSSTLGRQ